MLILVLNIFNDESLHHFSMHKKTPKSLAIEVVF